MRKIFIEITKCLTGSFFGVGVLSVISMCMISNGYMFENRTGWTIGELFIRGDRELYLTDVSMSAWKIWQAGLGTWTGILLPLALGFGYIYSLGEEGKTGNTKFLLVRESKFSYCASKMVACMVAGGIILLIGYGIFGLSVFARFPKLEDYGEGAEIFFGGEIKGNLMVGEILRRCMDVFLYGVGVNVFAFGVTIFFRDKYVTMCFPIMISYMYTVLLQKFEIMFMRQQEYGRLEIISLFKVTNIVNGIGWKSRLGTFLGIVAIYLVLLCLFLKMMNRREVAPVD